MYDQNTIFAKILRKEIPCNTYYEDEFSLFFYDINPQAKIHLLAIPKYSCVDYADFISKADQKIILSFFNSINIVIEKLKIKQSGYRLISNSGQNGGQEVPHFHIHILAGEKIGSLR